MRYYVNLNSTRIQSYSFEQMEISDLPVILNMVYSPPNEHINGKPIKLSAEHKLGPKREIFTEMTAQLMNEYA